ncbi:NAD(P)-binding domain-containing protein, partial [Streptomyces sp. NPDC057757]|uniref:NAD(P)-binding domain-containing protein n=1 Tax=Streptomyces sp. NPDC057757 TaxID=3346241 RepID=UPI0036AC8862
MAQKTVETSPETHVTLLGLGAMGTALARAWLAAGHPLTVWNRTAARAEPLAAAPPDHAAAEHRLGMAVRRWRRVMDEYVEDELRGHERATAPEPETVAGLLGTVLLGGRRGRAAGEELAERVGAQ